MHGSWEEDDLRIYLAPQCPYTIYPNHGPLVPSLLIPEVDEGKIGNTKGHNLMFRNPAKVHQSPDLPSLTNPFIGLLVQYLSFHHVNHWTFHEFEIWNLMKNHPKHGISMKTHHEVTTVHPIFTIVLTAVSLLTPCYLVVWNMFSHILGIVTPTDEYFSEGPKPPTSMGFLRAGVATLVLVWDLLAATEEQWRLLSALVMTMVWRRGVGAISIWLVVWNIWIMFSIQLGMSSSQLTNSLHHFSEG